MSRRRAVLLGVLVLVAAFWLRAQHARDRTGVWRDEAQDFFLVKENPEPGALLEALREEGHPPLHYLIEHAVVHRLGGGPAALRAVNVAFGVLTVLLMMLLGARCFGARAGLLAGLFAATSPFFIYYSAEMRAYALFGLAGVLHAWAYLGLLRRRSWGAAALWGASAALLAYAHYYGFFAVFAGGLFALLRDRTAPNLARIALAAAVGAALFAPWLPSFLAQMSHDLQPWYRPDRKLRGVVLLFLLPLGKWGGLLVAWSLVAGIVVVRRGGADAERATALRGLLVVGVGAALVAWIVQHRRGPFVARYLIAMAGPLLVAVAFRWGRLLERGGRQRAIGLGLVVLALLFQWTDKKGWLRRDVSPAAGIAARVEQHEREGDLVWIAPAFFAPSFNFHYRGALPRLAPPYRRTVTYVSWIDLPRREQDADLQLSFLDELESHLRAGRRVWLVIDGNYPYAKRWADLRIRADRGLGLLLGNPGPRREMPPMIRRELEFYKRTLRLLYHYAEDVYFWDGPETSYHEPMSLVLFDPARKR